jgi:hypothetical protein
MVEIVGKDLSVVKICTCRNCGSILRYGNQDLRKYSGTDYSGGPDGREWIICPGCGEDVTIRSW